MSWVSAVPLILFWLFLGPFVTVFYFIIGDMVNLLRVLCEYQTQDDEKNALDEKDLR